MILEFSLITFLASLLTVCINEKSYSILKKDAVVFTTSLNFYIHLDSHNKCHFLAEQLMTFNRSPLTINGKLKRNQHDRESFLMN